MQIHVVKSKIHRVKVTGADLNYIGSITIDEDLMDAANIIEGEKVQIVNNNNGERLETYAIPGPRNSGEITLNGAAARRVAHGDVLILITYALMELEEAKTFKTSMVFPDEETNLLRYIEPLAVQVFADRSSAWTGNFLDLVHLPIFHATTARGNQKIFY